MSTTPPSKNEKKSEDSVGDDWRLSVPQSQRNAEVREIARVLSSLEPGSTEASKLRLAMQFEDSVFKSANALADYRKTLTKRLKKVQKNYKPPKQSDSIDNAKKERSIQELRQKYGDSVKYIVKHSEKAFVEMKIKHGEEKAVQLKQHTDGVRVWAADLGLLENNTKPNLTMSEDHLKRLKEHLERRLENIRCHVVKLAEPDQFMAENFEKVEKDFKDKTAAVNLLADYSQKRYEQWQKKTVNAEELLVESLEQANKAVPLPTRNQRNDERAALIHLDKMRAASTALFAYMAIKDKSKVPKSMLAKVHSIARDGTDFVQKVVHEHRKQQKDDEVTLQDAWVKPLVLARPVNDDAVDGAVPSPVRRPGALQNKRPPVLRSRVLLTTNRKTPTNILMALKRKRATLVRPPPSGEGSYLMLEFGKAFVMTIFFVPLLVTIRAQKRKNERESDADKEQPGAGESEWKCASWTPLSYGLTDYENDELRVWGANGSYETVGSLVEERLRDASAHATQTLRKCFEKHVKEGSTQEFEIEIYEASALLEFLQLARTTFIPNWEDDGI